jgi:hypothetical protein
MPSSNGWHQERISGPKNPSLYRVSFCIWQKAAGSRIATHHLLVRNLASSIGLSQLLVSRPSRTVRKYEARWLDIVVENAEALVTTDAYLAT